MRHFECLHRFDGVIGHDFGVGLLSSRVVGFRMLGTLVFRSVFGFASVLVGMRVRLQLLAGFDVLLRWHLLACMPLRVRSCGLARIHLLIRRRVRFDVCVFAQRRGDLGVLLFSGMRLPSMRQRGVAVLRRFVCRLFAGVFVRVRVFVAKLIGRVAFLVGRHAVQRRGSRRPVFRVGCVSVFSQCRACVHGRKCFAALDRVVSACCTLIVVRRRAAHACPWPARHRPQPAFVHRPTRLLRRLALLPQRCRHGC